MPEMTIGQRALQFWSVLVLAAKDQKRVSYNMLWHLTGMARSGVGKPLGHIAAYCKYNELPRLNIIAIGELTGKPEAEFLQDLDLITEQSRVFVYDWVSHGAPSVEELENAYARAQATGEFKAVAP